MHAPSKRALVLTGLFVVAACSEARLGATCEEFGLCESAPPAPEEFILVIDGTPGSTANLASVERALAVVLDRAVEHPHSTIRVWTVGTGPSDSREVVSVEVPSPPRRMRNPRAHRTEVTAQLRDAIIPPAAAALNAATMQRRSAIADTLTLAARSFVGSGRRWLIVVSDLREMSRPRGLDLECRDLPARKRVQSNLEWRGLLGAGSLDGVDVVLVDLGLPPFPSHPRCDLSVRRGDQLFDLWRELLLGAGARSVVRGHGAVRFDEATDGTEP